MRKSSSFLLCFLFQFSLFARQPVELGLVHWSRDLKKSQELSKQNKKPIFILFQEVPGCSTCQRYGHDVMSHPLIVEAIEYYFNPVCIYNNEAGKDREALEYFKEPSWNNPVVRIVDSELNSIGERLHSNYSPFAVVNKINLSILRSGKLIPEYLRLLEEELLAGEQGKETITVGMYCFWSGEKVYGAIDGVVSTQAGFMGGSEVVQIHYNPKKTTADEIVARGSQQNCADRVFLQKHQNIQAKITSKEISTFKADHQIKYYLQQSTLRFVPMTEIQAARVNSALAQGKSAEHFLSPNQLNCWKQKKSVENFIGKNIYTGSKELLP
ncbi:MAG TPA: VPGUxxT family thioredoxin-like (seleno)protein, type 2 [Saprospiraceae bacterium]|nr:VPGUxxT family thioredoxin-like (seleno)protein, type 2 [Saprospiraceae bacterium]